MPVDLVSDRIVTARKEHECSYWPWDGHCIQPGEKYRRSTLVFDDMYTWRSCAFHEAVARHMMRTWDYPDGIAEEDMRFELYEIWGDAERSADAGRRYEAPKFTIAREWEK